MARLQILELPEGSGDDRPPFVLVIDQADDDLYADLAPTDTDGHQQSRSAHLAEQLGARAVLCFHGTIEIPANDTTAYLESSGSAEMECVLKVGDHDVREAIAADMQKMRDANEDRILDSRQACLDAQRLADERTDIARDMDRLAKRRDELANALGMEQGSSWDDIRDVAAELRKTSRERGEAVDRVLGLPYQPEIMDAQHAEPTGYQHGYRIAIQDAKRAVGYQSEHPTEKQSRA